jgi:Caspase domain
MLRFALIITCVVSCALGGSLAAHAEKRAALVIGNSEYKYTPRLENPKNDAADMAEMLGKLGFTVLAGYDLDKAAMDRKVRDFAQALAGAQVGLFFYAGHGLQVGGQNYLVPTDAELAAASAIDFELERLDLVQRTMEREASTNILIMDACRDNPLARNLARALGTRSSQIGHGFAPAESGEGTLIAFSTQPGNVALDGAGRNSPYAAALLKHIATPGDDLPTILINVRNDVMQVTARKQVPWEHSAMTAKFYFIPPKTNTKQIELEFWASVKDSNAPAVLRTYLERYPDGEFAPIARALIEHYERQLKAEAAAREAAAAQDKRRLEAVKAAEEAVKEEERITSGKREAERTGDPSKTIALKIEKPSMGSRGPDQFDGTWTVLFSNNAKCSQRTATRTWEITQNVVQGNANGRAVRGTVSSSGQLKVEFPALHDASRTVRVQATLQGASGAGKFEGVDGCGGTVRLTLR